MPRRVVVDFDAAMRRRWGMGQLAAWLNQQTGTREWTSQKVLRALRPHGAVKFVLAPGATKGRYYTTMGKVRSALPDLWEEMQLGRAVVEDV